LAYDQIVSLRRFSLTHKAALLVFCIYFITKRGNWSADSLLFWPVAYFTSLWILGPLTLYHFRSSLSHGKKGLLIRHLLGAVLFGLFHLVLSFFLIVVLERFFRLPEHYSLSGFPLFLKDSWWYITDGLLWYLGYAAAFTLVYLYQKLLSEREKTAQAQVEAYQSQMHTLRSELSPHFLYNAMNSIAMKVRLKENKEAVSMIAALNDLLRVVLSKKQEKMVTLAEEINILSKYICIEKIRFGEKVSIQQEFPENLYDAMVPQLLLQPIVENAFKHGIRDNLSKQEISISAHAEGNWLIFIIFNSAENPHRIVTPVESNGIGISNVLERLKRIYGTEFRFKTERTDQSISFKISIPFQEI